MKQFKIEETKATVYSTFKTDTVKLGNKELFGHPKIVPYCKH